MLTWERALEAAERQGVRLCSLCGAAAELDPLLKGFDHGFDDGEQACCASAGSRGQRFASVHGELLMVGQVIVGDAVGQRLVELAHLLGVAHEDAVVGQLR